jgi:hypothetical protein
MMSDFENERPTVPQLHEWFEDAPGTDEPTRPSRHGADLSNGDTDWMPEAFAWPWSAVPDRRAALSTFLFVGEQYGKSYGKARQFNILRDVIPPQKKCSGYLFRGLVLARITTLANNELRAELGTEWDAAPIEEIESDPRYRTFRAGFDWAYLIHEALLDDRKASRAREDRA